MNMPLLILDLDETLIYATEKPLDTPHDFLAGPYFVYKRPCLEEFIETIAGGYQLAGWSSSSADYVTAIVRQIFPERIPLQFAWSRLRCIQCFHPEWMTTYWVKDLKKVKRLGYDLNRTLIVDDTPRKVERNYGNAVYVSPYEGDQNDRELRLLAPYLMSLKDCENVRGVEKRYWRSQSRA